MIISESLNKEIIEYIEKDQLEIYWDYNSCLSAEQVAKSLISEDSYYEVINELWDINDSYIIELKEHKIKETIEHFYLKICEENSFEYNDFDELWEDYENEFYSLYTDYVDVELNEKQLIKNHEGLILTKIYSTEYELYHNFKNESYDSFKPLLDFANINPRLFAQKYGLNPINFPDIPSRNYQENFNPLQIYNLITEVKEGVLICLGAPNLLEYLEQRNEFDKGIIIKKGSAFISYNFISGTSSDIIYSKKDIILLEKYYSYQFYEDKSVRYGVHDCGFISSVYNGVVNKYDFKLKFKNYEFRNKNIKQNIQLQRRKTC